MEECTYEELKRIHLKAACLSYELIIIRFYPISASIGNLEKLKVIYISSRVRVRLIFHKVCYSFIRLCIHW